VALAVPFDEQFHYVFDTVFFYQAYQRFSFLELGKPLAAYRLHGANKSVTVRSARIMELASFERLKFGERSFRSRYLSVVGRVAAWCESHPKIGERLSRLLYGLVNTASFVSFYRLPGI
jgi:hypothetical protein